MKGQDEIINESTQNHQPPILIKNERSLTSKLDDSGLSEASGNNPRATARLKRFDNIWSRLCLILQIAGNTSAIYSESFFECNGNISFDGNIFFIMSHIVLHFSLSTLS